MDTNANITKGFLDKPEIKKIIFDITHPVNSFAEFDRATDMSQLSNGTWELVYQGKVGGTTTNLQGNSVYIPLSEVSAEQVSYSALRSYTNSGSSRGRSWYLTNGANNMAVYCEDYNGTLSIATIRGYSGANPIVANTSNLNFHVDLSQAYGAIEKYIYKRTA